MEIEYEIITFLGEYRAHSLCDTGGRDIHPSLAPLTQTLSLLVSTQVSVDC